MRLPILHHFEASPFSEKIRVIFGFKGLPWQSVLVPRIMPKPYLLPLTGGYRRTPVMQIGADIFCDTQIILRKIESLFPQPTIGDGGLPWMTGLWTDRFFFNTTVNLVFGSLCDNVPQSFIDDRTELRGAPFDVKQMAAALPHHRDQYRAQVALIEQQLAHGKPWLLDEFSVADANAYMNVWYVRSNLPALADQLIDSFPRVQEWEKRVRAFGHGSRLEISALDALKVAAQSEPSESLSASVDHEGRKAGDLVRLTADEPVKTSITGRIISISENHVAIQRNDKDVGDIVVHFPRIGYQLTDLKNGD